MSDGSEKQSGTVFPENQRDPSGLREEALLLSKAVTGDRPSLYALGMVASKAMERNQVAVLMTDVRGVVHLLPPSAVQVLARPRVPDEDLDQLEEEEALRIIDAEGRTEDEAISYLKARDERKR